MFLNDVVYIFYIYGVAILDPEVSLVAVAMGALSSYPVDGTAQSMWTGLPLI